MTTNGLYELRCRECGKTWGKRSPLVLRRLLLPLEVAYDYDSLKENCPPRKSRRARLQHVALFRASPSPRRTLSGPNAVGGTAASRLPQARGKMGLEESLFQE